jgi:GNAT superfamily N-acetyltransferase
VNAAAESSVRRGSVEDLPAIEPLGARFYAEARLPGRFVPAVWAATWQRLLAGGNGALFLLERTGEVCGALGAIIFPDPNDGDLVASEMFWFVAPEARGAGLRLLGAFEAWAAERGAQRLGMVHLATAGADRLAKLYERRGYRCVQTDYLKEI